MEKMVVYECDMHLVLVDLKKVYPTCEKEKEWIGSVKNQFGKHLHNVICG